MLSRFSSKISVLSLIPCDFIRFDLATQPAEIFRGLFALVLQKSNFCGREKEIIMKPV